MEVCGCQEGKAVAFFSASRPVVAFSDSTTEVVTDPPRPVLFLRNAQEPGRP